LQSERSFKQHALVSKFVTSFDSGQSCAGTNNHALFHRNVKPSLQHYVKYGLFTPAQQTNVTSIVRDVLKDKVPSFIENPHVPTIKSPQPVVYYQVDGVHDKIRLMGNLALSYFEGLVDENNEGLPGPEKAKVIWSYDENEVRRLVGNTSEDIEGIVNEEKQVKIQLLMLTLFWCSCLTLEFETLFSSGTATGSYMA
jgi:hypothetical protein